MCRVKLRAPHGRSRGRNIKESSRKRGCRVNNESERDREKTDVKKQRQGWKTQERWTCHRKTGYERQTERAKRGRC